MPYPRLITSGLTLALWTATVGCQRTSSQPQAPAQPQRLIDQGSSREQAPVAIPDLDRSQDPAAAAAAGRTPHDTEPVRQPAPPASGPAGPPGQPFPPVLLSERHRQTCLLQVGDQVPFLTLKDVQGTPHALRELWGPRLTVLVFWTLESAASTEQFLRLSTDVWEPWSPSGVAVIAVNVGGAPSQVENLSPQPEHVVSLLDPAGTAFAQFATDILPRTYLVDAAGTIIWFDLEYSLSTQRELDKALAHHLDQ
jgi:peroxiredoxin